MEDFYYNVRDALRDGKGGVGRLIEDFSADPKLIYEISSNVVTIPFNAAAYLKEIFRKSLGRFEYKDEKEKEKGIFLAIEIAFSAIFDPMKLHFHEFIVGETGNKDMCSWVEGDLLELSFEKARELGAQVSLGHTHPVVVPDNKPRRTYGAICSKIDWKEEELIEFGDPLSLKLLETGIYKKFGGDYSEMWTLTQENKLISNFALIMSPALDQLGVFEVKEGGRIVYHPWQLAASL